MATNTKIKRVNAPKASAAPAPKPADAELEQGEQKRRQRVAIVNPPIESPLPQGDGRERVLARLSAEEKVDVYVPRAFTYTAEKHVEIHFNAGVQPMAKSIASHWWVKAMGVEEYNRV